MSRQSTAQINHQLTGFAIGHANDLAMARRLAERLAPIVQVGGSHGQYKEFNDRNSFQVYNTARAMGGSANRIEFEAEDKYFNCKPQALEVTVDKEERRQAGEDNALAQQVLDEGKIAALINVTNLSHVHKVVTAVIAATTAVAGDQIGEWSNEDIDPIDQLDEQVDLLAQAVGNKEGIKLTMDLTSWRTLRNHPKTKARCNGVQVGGINAGQLNEMLAVPVDFETHAISYNAAALGQDMDKQRLGSGQVFLHYALPTPRLTPYDPSAFKIFTVGTSMVSGVRSYDSQDGFWNAHVIDWSEDLKLTSSISMRRIEIS